MKKQKKFAKNSLNLLAMCSMRPIAFNSHSKLIRSVNMLSTWKWTKFHWQLSFVFVGQPNPNVILFTANTQSNSKTEVYCHWMMVFVQPRSLIKTLPFFRERCTARKISTISVSIIRRRNRFYCWRCVCVCARHGGDVIRNVFVQHASFHFYSIRWAPSRIL